MTQMRRTIESHMRMKFHDDHGLDANISAKEIRRIYIEGMERFLAFVNEEFKKLIVKNKKEDI